MPVPGADISRGELIALAGCGLPGSCADLLLAPEGAGPAGARGRSPARVVVRRQGLPVAGRVVVGCPGVVCA